MMFISIVSADMLTQRMDAEHYEPELLAYERLVKDLPFSQRTMDSVRKPDAVFISGRCTRDGMVQPGDFKKKGDGVRLIRCTDVRDLTVDLDEVLWIDRDVEAAYPLSRVEPGDVLIGIAGTLGCVGLAPRDVVPANLNQSVVRLRGRTADLGVWTAVFLSTRHGQGILLRRAVGGVQRHLNLADLPQVPVPVPKLETMAYVAAKVRQAEVLRQRADSVVRSVEQCYVAASVAFDSSPIRASRVRASTLADRLDPGHYPKDVLDYLAQLDGPTATLGDLCRGEVFSGATLSPAFSGVHQATVANLNRVFLGGEFRTVETPRNEERRLRSHDLMIASAAHNASYIGKDVTYAAVSGPTYASTEVIVVRPDRDRLPASYVWCALRSHFGYRQIQACVRGITAHAYPDDLSRIVIPLPAPAVVERFRAADSGMLDAAQCVRDARGLLSAVRLLVEALIDRQVTENQLIEASRDPAIDRSLLGRLTSNGLDAGGEPLFPDLDAHLALVADAGPGP